MNKELSVLECLVTKCFRSMHTNLGHVINPIYLISFWVILIQLVLSQAN